MEAIIGIVHLVLVIWALVKIFQSGATTVQKIIWALIVFFLPIIGLVIWWFAGPK